MTRSDIITQGFNPMNTPFCSLFEPDTSTPVNVSNSPAPRYFGNRRERRAKEARMRRKQK